MKGPAGIGSINVTCGLRVEGTVSLVKPHNILSFMPPEFYVTGLSLNDIRCTIFPSVSNLAIKVLYVNLLLIPFNTSATMTL